MDWTWIVHGLWAALWVGLSLRAELAGRRARQIQSTAWTVIDSTKKAQAEAQAVLKSRALTTAELQALLNGPKRLKPNELV